MSQVKRASFVRTLAFLMALVFCFHLNVPVFSNPVSVAPPTAIRNETGMVLPANVEQSQNVKVVTYEVELNKTLSLPAFKPTFHLVKSPDVATVVQSGATEIVVRGVRIGETLILVWEETGFRSYRIIVTRPREEIKRIEQVAEESSKLYQNRRARSFKVYYDSAYQLWDQGNIYPKLREVQKVYDHHVRTNGATPFGQLEGDMFYEYRKAEEMEKSVGIPRDFRLGLFESDLPYLQRYDLIGFEQYLMMDYFGFPGQRINGFSVVPSESRIFNPEKGQLDHSFFIGAKRDGSMMDNPPGIQNRKVKGNVLGGKLDYYLWKTGKVSLGTYQQWSTPTFPYESKSNYDAMFDFMFPYFRLRGEGGLDVKGRPALQIEPTLQNRWGFVRTRWVNVDTHYATISGAVVDRGVKGFQNKVNFYPFLPLWNNTSVLIDSDFSWTKNRLSVNPDHPGRYLQDYRGSLYWRLPYQFMSESRFAYSNQIASSFPYTEKRMDQILSQYVDLNNKWVKRLRFFGTATVDSYQKSVNSPGFNSVRYEAGGGASAYLIGGMWVSAKNLSNYLKEKDPGVDTTKINYPNQTTIEGGWNYSFRRIPLNVYADARYIHETDTEGRIHQPFLNEDRFEMRGGWNFFASSYGSLFMQIRSVITESIIGAPYQAEFSMIGGVQTNWDTKFYIPQKGKIEGVFFQDLNANGARDPGEPGVMGYEIQIENGTKTQTDADGNYALNVKEGKVKLIAPGQLPEGYFYTTPNSQIIEVLPKSKTQVHFGIAAQIQVKGHVFLDVNKNQMFEKGDIPIAGIQVALNSGQIAMSGSEGFYSVLRVPPGSNKIRLVLESIPQGYRTLTSIEKNFEGAPGDVVNFNVILSAERSVSGYVFSDKNENGQLDPGERGLERVELKAGEQTAKTSKSGKYFLSDLKPGRIPIELNEQTLPVNHRAQKTSQEVTVGAQVFIENDVNFPVLETEKREQGT